MFENRAKLKHNILISISMKLFSALGLFVISVLLAKGLGAEKFGMYAVILSAAAVVSIPLSSGLPNLLTRETAISIESDKYELWKGLLLFAFFLVIIVSLIGGIGVLIYYFSSTTKNNNNFFYFVIVASIIPLMGLDRLRGSVMQGLGSPIISQVPESIIRPYSYLVFIFVGLLFYKELTLSYAFIAYIISVFISFIVGSILLNRMIAKRLNTIKPKFKIKYWFWSLFSLGGLSASQILIGNADILILGWLTSAKEVGVYKVALQGLALMVTAQTGIGAVLISKLSQAFARNDLKDIIYTSDISVLIFTIMITIAFIAIYLFGIDVVNLFFGLEYSFAIKILLILALGQIVNATTGPVIILLIMSKNEVSALISFLLGGFTMFFLAILLIPSYGTIGMAFASSLGVLISSIAMAINTYKKLGFDPTIIGAFRRFMV